MLEARGGGRHQDAEQPVSIPFRYLTPDERDFIAMFVRPQPGLKSSG